MAYTFATLYQEVGNNFDSQVNNSSRLKMWVNDAVNEIASRRRWSWLESLVTVASVNGQLDYTLVGSSAIVPDMDTMISVSHNSVVSGTTYQKLVWKQQQDFDDELGNALTNTGIPVYYTLRGGTPASTSGAVLAGGFQRLSIWPSPGFTGSLQIKYFRTIAAIEMTADSDVPFPPQQFRQAIVLLAIARGKAVTDQLIASNVAAQQAEAVLGPLVAADTANRGDDPPPDQRPVISRGPIPPSPSSGANPGMNPYGLDR